MRDEFEAQKKLLELAKDLVDVQGTRDQPALIIGINKVDDSNDAQTRKRVKKVMAAIEDVFKVGDRVKALERVLEDYDKDNVKFDDGTFPIVVPFSAKEAFFYRQFVGLSKEQFSRQKEEEVKRLAEKVLGTLEVRRLCSGQSQSQMSRSLFDKTFELASDTGDLLKDTGFLNVEMAINACLSGKRRQGYLISQQLRKEMCGIPTSVEGGYTLEFVDNLRKQRKVSDVIEGVINFKSYQNFFKKHIELAKGTFCDGPTSSDTFVKCLVELEEFEKAASLLYLDEKGDLISGNDKLAREIEKWTTESMLEVLRVQLEVIQTMAGAFLRTSKKRDGNQMARGRDGSQQRPIKWTDLTSDDYIDNLDAVKLQLDTSSISNRFPKERKAISQAISQLRLLPRHDTDTTDLSWVNIGERVLANLDKKKDKKLEEKIAVAAQRSSHQHSKELRSLKRSFDQLTQKIDTMQHLIETRLPRYSHPNSVSDLQEPTGGTAEAREAEMEAASDEYVAVKAHEAHSGSPQQPVIDMSH